MSVEVAEKILYTLKEKAKKDEQCCSMGKGQEVACASDPAQEMKTMEGEGGKKEGGGKKVRREEKQKENKETISGLYLVTKGEGKHDQCVKAEALVEVVEKMIKSCQSEVENGGEEEKKKLEEEEKKLEEEEKKLEEETKKLEEETKKVEEETKKVEEEEKNVEEEKKKVEEEKQIIEEETKKIEEEKMKLEEEKKKLEEEKAKGGEHQGGPETAGPKMRRTEEPKEGGKEGDSGEKGQEKIVGGWQAVKECEGLYVSLHAGGAWCPADTEKIGEKEKEH